MLLSHLSHQTPTYGFGYLHFPVPKPKSHALPQFKYKDLIKSLPYILVVVGTFFLPSIAAKYVPECMKDTGFKDFDRKKDSMTGYSFRWWKQLVLPFPTGKEVKFEPLHSKGKAIVKIVKVIGVFLINAFAGEKLSIFLGGKGGKDGKGEVPPEKPPEKPPETPPEKPPEAPTTPPTPPTAPDPGGMI